MKLGDSGAILVEFAIILPVLLLLTLGMFEVGLVMVQSLQLNFVTQGAAFAEATAIAEATAKTPNPGFSPGSGISWATSQLPSASFFPGSGAGCVASNMPVKTMILPLPQLSTQACWPVPG
jgi:hypothetical protein